MSVNAEVGFITQLLATGDMSTVVDSEISSRYLNGNNKKAFKFILDHQTKYGKVPSIEVFQKKFPTYNLADWDGEVGTGEELQYWCDELRAKLKHNTLADGLEEALESLNELDTEDAYSTIKQVVLKVENEIVISDRILINQNTDKRKEDYLKRQKSGGMVGIPSFIEHWDGIIGGYNNGELITAMGYTGIGKSWWEIIQSVAQAKAGYRVLFFTTEMSTKMVMRRIDAVWCGLNYTDFRKGQLKPEQEKKYFQYLKDMEGSDTNLIVEQATGGVSQISAKIDQYKPDIVFIDGAYLLEDEEGEEDNWMGAVRVWRALHRLCLLKDIPIVATTQSKDETGATLKSLSFAKAIANECDVVVVLEQDAQMRNDREMRMKPLKIREGDLLNSVFLNWDFNTMKYGSIFKDSKAEPAPLRENTKGVITID